MIHSRQLDSRGRRANSELINMSALKKCCRDGKNNAKTSAVLKCCSSCKSHGVIATDHRKGKDRNARSAVMKNRYRPNIKISGTVQTPISYITHDPS